MPGERPSCPAVTSMERMIKRNIDALEDIFSLLEGQLTEHGATKSTVFTVKLAIEELFTNMVRHNVGGRSHIALYLSIDNGCIVVSLTDYNVEQFDPSRIEPVNVHRTIEEIKPGGLGVHLVKNIVDELKYEYDDGNLKATIVKRQEE